MNSWCSVAQIWNSDQDLYWRSLGEIITLIIRETVLNCHPFCKIPLANIVLGTFGVSGLLARNCLPRIQESSCLQPKWPRFQRGKTTCFLKSNLSKTRLSFEFQDCYVYICACNNRYIPYLYFFIGASIFCIQNKKPNHWPQIKVLGPENLNSNCLRTLLQAITVGNTFPNKRAENHVLPCSLRVSRTSIVCR